MYGKTRAAATVRQGEWKLIQHRGRSRIELFKLDDDSLETTDLADKQPALHLPAPMFLPALSPRGHRRTEFIPFVCWGTE
jgi:hypothetical protein